MRQQIEDSGISRRVLVAASAEQPRFAGFWSEEDISAVEDGIEESFVEVTRRQRKADLT